MLKNALLVIVSFLTLLLVGCQQNPGAENQTLSGATMGTTWSVVMHSLPSEISAKTLQLELEEKLVQINHLMSTYDPESELSRFNNQTTSECFAISAETAEVVALSKEISRLTSGAFDASVGPLVELWGFGARVRGKDLPTAQEISDTLSRVGFQKFDLCPDRQALKKQIPGLRLDFSAVAKGYAVDALAEILLRCGVQNFIVDIGGELRVSGARADGSRWRIAIEKPQEEVREIESIFPMPETGLATSGNYRNYYIENGQRYVHTIDPATGQPVRHKLVSATILSPTSARADALATAMMVMGEERAKQFCEKNQIAAYFLILDKDAMMEYRSPAFNALIGTVEK